MGGHATVPFVDAASLLEPAARRYTDFVDSLRDLVNIDSGSYTPEGVNEIAEACQERFRAGGWKVERTPHAPAPGGAQLGDLVIGRLDGAGGPRVLLIGHMDTVFDPGTARERPFRIDGSIARGPGVSDMKGGLLLGFHAVELLREVGFDAFRTITYICNPDEEIGSPFSREAILRLAADADTALVLEGGRENGDFVSARKGVTDITVDIGGRAAHAGVEPEKGCSAILEAAHKTIALQELNGRWPDVTVNVGVVHGGTRTNVVPEHAALQVDVRAPAEDDLAAAEDEIRSICASAVVPGTDVRLTEHAWHRPMEKTPPTAALARLATDVASELGFELRDAATGGASDANTTSAAGVPTIDGLGPVGGDDHAPGEWIDLTTVVPRMALLAGVIARAGSLAEERS
jgi:glutamate carboxypeptidase